MAKRSSTKRSTSKKMTSRQRQSQKIMREKAAQKKRQAFKRKLYVIGGCGLMMAAISISAWVWQTGFIGRTARVVTDGMYRFTADIGFSVDELYLDGRSRTSMAEVNKALNIKKGDPILRVSLDEVRERLEAVESIASATVERALPNTVYVQIAERKPVALWQRKGKVALIDDNGVVMSDLDIKPYQKLPLIIGDDAALHVKELLEILSVESKLSRLFSAAIRIGDRRWNIRIAKGGKDIIEVKLPEDNAVQAWKKLADMQQKQQVLDRDIKEIDLRLEGRMFIKLAPDQKMNNKNGSARDA